MFLQSLNANVAAGKAVNNPSIAVSFPTDNSNASQAARIETALVTLQNLNGPGKGCPAASTTFSVCFLSCCLFAKCGIHFCIP
jgi:hypothetical protein